MYSFACNDEKSTDPVSGTASTLTNLSPALSATPGLAPSKLALDGDYDSGSEEEFDDAVLAVSMPINERCASPNALEFVPGKTRRRKRDGKIVKKSPIGYHLYKISKKHLQKRKVFNVGSAEDCGLLEKECAGHWVHARRFQCRLLANVLLSRDVINNDQHESIMYEIEGIMEWITGNVDMALKVPMGSSGLWMALMAQQQRALAGTDGWAFRTQDEVDLWSLPNLFEHFRQTAAQKVAPDMRSKYVRGCAFDQIDDAFNVARGLHLMLSKANLPMKFNCVRKHKPNEPWLYKRIRELQTAKLLGSDIEVGATAD